MKKMTLKSLAVLTISLIAFTANAQRNIEGDWQGRLAVGTTSLRLVFHIKNEGGNYSATMDSPDQGAKSIPFNSVQVKGDSLLMELKAIGGRLSGRLTSDTTFSGQWFQGTSFPLDLKKVSAGETVTELKRPQTPKPPFPYKSEDVVYFNKSKSIQYGATITSPGGSGPFPAIIFITGSGQQNRDEELFGHKPFAVLADYLTSKGYVVMRVDDRGVGQTTGDVKNATSKDFASDVMVGLDYLKGLPQVAKTKLGLLGHSEGGMIAQIVSAQRSDVAFVVSLAGPGQRIDELMLDQAKAVMQSAGTSKKIIDDYNSLQKRLVPAIITATSDSTAKTVAKKIIADWKQKMPGDSVLPLMQITDEKDVEDMTDLFRTPWYSYFLKYNPAPYIQKMKGKVLVLNGEKDIQVAAGPNLVGWKTSLAKSGVKTYDVTELKGLNHLFQHCTKCTVAEYGELEETMAPEALEAISTWLEKNVR